MVHIQSSHMFFLGCLENRGPWSSSSLGVCKAAFLPFNSPDREAEGFSPIGTVRYTHCKIMHVVSNSINIHPHLQQLQAEPNNLRQHIADRIIHLTQKQTNLLWSPVAICQSTISWARPKHTKNRKHQATDKLFVRQNPKQKGAKKDFGTPLKQRLSQSVTFSVDFCLPSNSYDIFRKDLLRLSRTLPDYHPS